jgi:hypothetical protein
MRCAFVCVCVAAAAAISVLGDSGVTVQVKLERLESQHWAPVDPTLVLRGGDEVRFKFQSNRAGFLYVINHDASGRDTWLFPTPDTGERNEIEAIKDYVIPATAGVFEIAARPGYETTYWILSPVELRAKPKLDPAIERMDKTPLLPRCDDGPLTARGLCGDKSAGARSPGSAAADRWFEGSPKLQPREIQVDNGSQRSRVSMTSEFNAPLVYVYRIAHR